MKRTTKYVGLDVHQATTVAVVADDTGRVIARSVVPTEAAALLEFVRGMRGATHVALEEGTHAQRLYDLFIGRVARVVVSDRRGERHDGNKGDWHDAGQLMDELRTGKLPAVYHGSPHRATLREFARTYRTLTEDATRCRASRRCSGPAAFGPLAAASPTRRSGPSGWPSSATPACGFERRRSTPSSSCCTHFGRRRRRR